MKKLFKAMCLLAVLVLFPVMAMAADVYFDEDFESYNIGESAHAGDFYAVEYPWDAAAWKAMEEGDNMFLRMTNMGNSPLNTSMRFTPKPTGMYVDLNFRSDSEIWIGLSAKNLNPDSPRFNQEVQLITWWANGNGHGWRDFEGQYFGVPAPGYIPTVNEWHHFRQEIIGSVVKIYIDGEFRQESDFGQLLTDFQIVWGSNGVSDDIDNILVQDIPYTITVNMDVRPDQIKMNRGKMPVTIYSTAKFDATKIDQTSLTFGVTGNEKSLSKCELVDANSDGQQDMVCTFYRTMTGFAPGNTTAFLKGKTIGGMLIEGSSPVSIK